MLPEVLNTIAELNAVDVLKRLTEKFASEMSRIILKSGQEVNRALLEAAKFGQEKLLAVLLEIGVDPKGTYQDMNALYRACEFGQINCVEILLARRARTAVEGTQRYDPLVVAVLHGKLDLVKFLLEEKVSGIERDPETFEMKDLKVKWNALHYAIVKGQKEIVEYLLSQSSALQNIKTMDGIAPLQLAALRNEIEMCQWLVQKGVEPKTLLTFPDGDLEDWHRRVLICKDYFVMVQGDINFKDDRGKTALHCAAEYGHLELVRELIELGADVEATDAKGWNATHFALEEFQTRKRNNSNTVFDILKLLHLKNNRLASQKTKDGRTNLHIIYEKEGKCSEEVLRFLVEEAGVEVNAVDSRGGFVLNKNINCWNKEFLYTYAKSGKLHSAVETGNLKLVQQLCESGVDLNATGRHGMTALMIAGKLNQVQIIEFLLAKNVNIKKKDGTGKNALHHSLHNFEITQLLHKKEKSLVKKLTIDGCTSLHLATNDQNGSMEVIRWLVDKIKINVNTCNERGETALMLASIHGLSSDVLELLLDKGADVNKEDNSRRTALMYTVVHENLNLFPILLERGAHLNYSLQALQYAFLDLNLLKMVYNRNKELLKEVDEQGNTILHKAIKNEPKECSLVVVWWLIEELKIDLEVRNKKGETALLVACKEERWEVVDLLLSKNVDVTAKDSEGKSAVDYAPFLNI
ncbi:Hypothetical predicted protein [Cloeon dipterum]|uniref:Uncharacterized protein n=1 Tax=Cloeon dipterum TaxID=197152 RepID=A0A8S1DNL1_9INSE|nr:Hypothetical predicted protein [Cloeon dipterum]